MKDKWVERHCRVYVSEERESQWDVTVQACVSDGEDIHEEMHRMLDEGLWHEGDIMYEEPHATRQWVHQVEWQDEDGATCSVIFNPPKEV